MTTATKQSNELAGQAKDAASSAIDKVKDAASNVGQAVGNVASAVGQTADNATGSVGSGVHWLGDKVREKGPEKGVLGSVTGTVANALEGAGEYLEEKQLSGMFSDVKELISHHPLPAVLVGIGLGILLGGLLAK